MRILSYLFVAFILVLVGSCRNDFEFEPSSGNLEFSRDTVYLDTVFTNIGSSTYTLKVYNRSDKDIKIPSIKLGEGENSKYRLMVDGMSGKVFSNVELLAKDSMFVFIETTIDYSEYANSETTFLYTDQIQFSSINGQQNVELVTLVQDAYFLYQKPDEDDLVLDETDEINGNELIWTNEKPYVIYGYAKVPNNKILEVQEGAKIYLHDSSAILVTDNASIQVNGTIENPVVFEGDRLEPFFSDVPGQWDMIFLSSGSVNNSFKNTIIKNSIIGLFAQNCSLSLENVQIYNASNFGILAYTADIDGFNVVINNSGLSSLACTMGGNYTFKHSTIANYWNRSHRSYPSLIINDNYQDESGAYHYFPLTAHFENCIVFGSNNIEFQIDRLGNEPFNYSFTNSLIKFIDTNNRFANNPLYDFDNVGIYMNCLISKTFNSNKVDFVNGVLNDVRILETSAAKGTANSNFSSTNDILGNPRNGNSQDMGAYNFVIVEE